MLKLQPKPTGAKRGYQVTEEQKVRLEAVSARLKRGERRDWLAAAEAISDIVPITRHTEQTPFDPQALTPYQCYVLVLGDRLPGVLKGNGPRIAGIQTPHHNGDGYEAQRAALIECLAEAGIKWSTSKGWYREDDLADLRFVIGVRSVRDRTNSPEQEARDEPEASTK